MRKERLQAMIPVHTPDLESLYGSKRDADKARVLLQHLFYVYRAMKQNSSFAPGLNRDDRWCPINSKNLKAMVWDHQRIRDVLIENEVIEYKKSENGGASYYPGLYSMLYRVKFPDELLMSNGSLYRREYITSKVIIKAVERYYFQQYDRQRRRLLNSTPWYKPCLEFMDRLRIQIDQDELIQKDEDRIATVEQFNDGLSRYVTRDEYGRRIHSYVSHLPKDLRPYLKLDGEDEKLVLVDVKNSQAYFLAVMFRYPGILHLIPEFEQVSNVISDYRGSSSIRMFYDHSRSGALYDNLMTATNMSRKEFKKMLFGHVFFAAPYHHRDDEDLARERRYARNLFGMQYRDALELLDKLKLTTKKTLPLVYDMTRRKGKKGKFYSKMYATPNMMAQRLETKILLDLVTRSLLEEGIDVCTLHDAWILREQDLEAFKTVFQIVFDRLGLDAPTLDEEVLEPASLV